MTKKQQPYRTIVRMSLPDIKTTDKGKKLAHSQPFTVANYCEVVRQLGYDLRFNIMAGDVEVWVKGKVLTAVKAVSAFEMIDDALIWLQISPTRSAAVRDTVAMDGHAYHPMGDWIDSAKWDGADRISELTETVPTDTELWPIYLRKWLIQLMEGVYGWESTVERSLPHVLTFTGAQGVNKGRWIRALSGDRKGAYVTSDAELHLGGYGEKDSLLNVLSRPIAELGEIDATFKVADISSLKSFLSRPVDSIRRPYGRRAMVRPRMTCFIGSVNRVEFLVDATGSRRFWPVELRAGEKLEWDHGLDMQQVYAQAYVLWAGGEDWNLGVDDETARAEDAVRFAEVPAVAELASAHWAKYGGDISRYAVLNRTEISRVVGGSLQPVQLRELGDWLKSNMGSARTLWTNKAGGASVRKQRCWAWPVGEHSEHVLLSAEAAENALKSIRTVAVKRLRLVADNDENG